MRHTSELKRLSKYLISESPHLDLRKWRTCAVGYLRYAARTELQFEFDSEDIRPYYGEHEGIGAVREYFGINLDEFSWLFHHNSYGDCCPSAEMVGERISRFLLERGQYENVS